MTQVGSSTDMQIQADVRYQNEFARFFASYIADDLQDPDGDRWIKEVALGPTPKPVVYMKHMAKQVGCKDKNARRMIQCRSRGYKRLALDTWGG